MERRHHAEYVDAKLDVGTIWNIVQRLGFLVSLGFLMYYYRNARVVQIINPHLMT